MNPTPSKLTSSLKYQHYAVAVFTGTFPLDAFRYDRCYPESEGDSRVIEEAVNYGSDSKTRYAVLTKYSEAAREAWFRVFWSGQSGLRLYAIDRGDIPAFREAVKAGTAPDWINRNLGVAIRERS